MSLQARIKPMPFVCMLPPPILLLPAAPASAGSWAHNTPHLPAPTPFTTCRDWVDKQAARAATKAAEAAGEGGKPKRSYTKRTKNDLAPSETAEGAAKSMLESKKLSNKAWGGVGSGHRGGEEMMEGSVERGRQGGCKNRKKLRENCTRLPQSCACAKYG